MAKNNDKRAKRMARSNRNVSRAITVLMAGVIAEFYLLMVNNYYVKGGVGQVLTMMTVLQVIDYIGCALFGAGLVVWLMRKKWTRFAPAAPWLLCIGFFFAVSSILMLKVYPQGTTMMCVIVPVVMLIGIVFLLYPREFSVQAVGLTASLMAMYLIHRGSGSDTWGGIVIGCSILAICVVAVLGVAVFKAGKNDGKHPTPRSIVTAHYTGWTINGKKFDSSRSGAPVAFRLSDLIEGWIIAMQQMCAGDKWEVYIPSEMGYGKFSQPGIPGGSTLIFEIELFGIA